MTRRPTTEPDPRGAEDLTLKLARLDVPAAAFFKKAMTGDAAAAEAYLEIVDRRILLLAPDRTGIQH
jgi:hypothetical protein